MGRWTKGYAIEDTFDAVDAHNADCDAYEARIAELEAKVKSQRSRISQLTHGMADERKANNKLLANIEQLKEWNAEALEENNRLDVEADAARQYAHTMDLQNADYGRVVRELARVKAESLRVVPIGGRQIASSNRIEYFTLDGDVYHWESCQHERDEVFARGLTTGRDLDLRCSKLVQPVRLERWEMEE